MMGFIGHSSGLLAFLVLGWVAVRRADAGRPERPTPLSLQSGRSCRPQQVQMLYTSPC